MLWDRVASWALAGNLDAGHFLFEAEPTKVGKEGTCLSCPVLPPG